MAGLQVLGCSTVMLLLLLLLPASTQQFFHRESQEQEQPLDRDTEDALSVLRNVKRRVIGTSECRNWNEPCVPWANDPRNACCDQDALLCRCNLWMQNCRCVARAWGK